MSDHYDAIVVGLGICGSALAYSLGKQGRRVLAIERDLSEPDKIIGEVGGLLHVVRFVPYKPQLLQPGGVARLTTLGMAECLEGIDSPPILGYAVYTPNGAGPVAVRRKDSFALLLPSHKHTKLPYPKVHGERPRGRSFHHGRFIMNLRKKARETVACVLEATVTGLEERDGRVVGVRWKAPGGGGSKQGISTADFTFCCDGLFSSLRESFTSSVVTHKSKFVGLILRVAPLHHDVPLFVCEADITYPQGNAAAQLPFPNHGHVFCIHPRSVLLVLFVCALLLLFFTEDYAPAPRSFTQSRQPR